MPIRALVSLPFGTIDKVAVLSAVRAFTKRKSIKTTNRLTYWKNGIRKRKRRNSSSRFIRLRVKISNLGTQKSLKKYSESFKSDRDRQISRHL